MPPLEKPAAVALLVSAAAILCSTAPRWFPDPPVGSLHAAAAAGHVADAEALLQRGTAPVDLRDNQGLTALHVAVMQDEPEVVQLLLRYGAASGLAEPQGFAALHIAAQMGFKRIVEVLVVSAEVDRAAVGNVTALHMASAVGHAAIVRRLLEAGAAPNAVSLAGATALLMAAGNGHAEVVRRLLDDGRTAIDARNEQRFNALHASAAAGHTEVVRLLLARGLSPHAVANEGYCPLLLAGQKGHTATVRALLEHGGPARCGAVCPDDDDDEPEAAPLPEGGHERPRQWRSYFHLESPRPGGSGGGSGVEGREAQTEVEAAAALPASRVVARSLPSALPAAIDGATRERLAQVHATDLATAETCEAIIAEAERHAAAHGGWSAAGHHDAYATTDIVVVLLPGALRWLNGALEATVWPLLAAQFGLAPHHFWLQDAFVVKYEVGGQTELRMHQDGSEISFHVLLSEPAAFEGGGTLFEAANATVHLRRGQLISHFGQLTHAGLPLASGLRYILVGLVRVRPLAEAHAWCRVQRC